MEGLNKKELPATQEGIPQEWFRAYLKGNIAIPQVGTGIAVYLASALLQGDGFSVDDLDVFWDSESYQTNNLKI